MRSKVGVSNVYFKTHRIERSKDIQHEMFTKVVDYGHNPYKRFIKCYNTKECNTKS